MLDEFDPKPKSEKARASASVSRHDANYWANEASIDELVANVHRDIINRQGEREFFNIILTGRYTEASVKTMQQLTEAINKASRSSAMIGWALFVATATAAIAAISVVLK